MNPTFKSLYLSDYLTVKRGHLESCVVSKSSRDASLPVSSLKVNGAEGPFWNELIPQNSETYSAVKHMDVAIASLQENPEKVHLNDSKNEGGLLPSMSLGAVQLGIQELIASERKTPLPKRLCQQPVCY